MPMIKRLYRFLDVGVCLESDSAEFADLFDNDYGLFRIQTPGDAEKLFFSVTLNKNKKDAAVRHGKEIFSLHGHPHKIRYAYQLVLKEIFNNIKEFFLIHAGVAAKDGKALVMSGPPGVARPQWFWNCSKAGSHISLMISVRFTKRQILCIPFHAVFGRYHQATAPNLPEYPVLSEKRKFL